MGKTLISSKTYIPPMANHPDLVAFQNAELDRFIHAYFKGDYSEGSLPRRFFTASQEQWEQWGPSVTDRTRRGLQKGIQRYIQDTAPEAAIIYETDIGDVIICTQIPEEIKREVGQLSFVDQESDALSCFRITKTGPNLTFGEFGFVQSVSNHYGDFLCEDSIHKYRALFSIKDKVLE